MAETMHDFIVANITKNPNRNEYHSTVRRTFFAGTIIYSFICLGSFGNRLLTQPSSTEPPSNSTRRPSTTSSEQGSGRTPSSRSSTWSTWSPPTPTSSSSPSNPGSIQSPVLPDVQDRNKASNRLALGRVHSHRRFSRLSRLHIGVSPTNNDQSRWSLSQLYLHPHSYCWNSFEVRLLRQDKRLHRKRPWVEQSDRSECMWVRHCLQKQIYALPLDYFLDLCGTPGLGTNLLHHFQCC